MKITIPSKIPTFITQFFWKGKEFRLFTTKLIVLAMVFGMATLPAAAQDNAGQVAITGIDGNIYVYDVASQRLDPITNDASLSEPQRFYSWPTWSTDGQLAYFGSSLDPNNLFGLGIFIKRVGEEPKGVFASDNEFFTYAYWAPADCPAGNCRDLAVLYSDDAGLAARLVRSADKFEITEISQGGPHYWDWSPDGTSMFWARYARTLEVYHVDTQETDLLPFPQGLTQAVDWSPIDNRLLAAVYDDSGVTHLSIIDGDEQHVLVDGLAGGLAAHWSPTGENVAYLDLLNGGLHIVEVDNDNEIAMPSAEAITFQWSPDGTKLAYITLTTANDRPNAMRTTWANWQAQGDDLRLEWNVYDLGTGTSTIYSQFLPSRDMIYYITYFDQFTHSHELWSPDSRYLVYGEVLTSNGKQVVSLIDTQTVGSPPITIADGTMGVFSW